ncbi:hypothetical protein FKM82_010882 [Ascaphus truei]
MDLLCQLLKGRGEVGGGRWGDWRADLYHAAVLLGRVVVSWVVSSVEPFVLAFACLQLLWLAGAQSSPVNPEVTLDSGVMSVTRCDARSYVV